MFKIISSGSSGGCAARAGELHTAHGKAETPFFMPVATKGTVKYVTPEELGKMPLQAVISNALVLSFMPGADLVKKAGGIHKFSGIDKTIFTDSGGFQMGSDRLFISATDKGVTFKNPIMKGNEGARVTLGPRDMMRIESDIGSDVAMCLDHMPPVLEKREYIEEATRRTHIWARICKDYHDQLNEEQGGKQLLFGIAQGGTHTDLRKKSAEFINSLGFDGIALGGLCIGETREAMLKAIEVQVPLLEDEKPRYLMGVGTPIDIIEAVARGVDCFDSKFPTQNARHGQVFTRKGMLNLTKSASREDFSPIDPDCGCDTCKRFTKAFLHHLFKAEEKTVFRHVSVHNTHFLQQMMEDIRCAIKEDRFGSFKKGFLESYSGKED